MNTRFVRIVPVLALLAALPGCAHSPLYQKPGDSTFGEANRETMMAQIINPDPSYPTAMTYSGEHAQQAVQRYREGKVKQPDTVQSAGVSGGSGSGSGSGMGGSSTPGS